MAMRFSFLRLAIVGAMLAIFALAAVPAVAQQPTQVNPTASSVKEDQLLKALGITTPRSTSQRHTEEQAPTPAI